MAEKSEMEKLLDAIDKFKEGDKAAFDGMTINLDSDDKTKCLDEDS